MALQTSGAISLNDMHIEVGSPSGTTVSLNNGDIRDLIGKASGAQSSFSEFYGASATDAVETELFGNSWGVGFFGYSGSSSNLDTPVYCAELSKGSVASYPHAWPCAADGEPHAFTSEFPSAIRSWYNSPGSGIDYSNLLPTQFDLNAADGASMSSAQWQKYSPYGGHSFSASTNATNNPGIIHTRTVISPLQRIKAGNRTFNGYTRDSGSGNLNRYQSITTYLREYETMTPHSSGLYATAGGATRLTQLGNSVTAESQTQNFSQTVNVVYEWCFLQTISRTASYSSRSHTSRVESIS